MPIYKRCGSCGKRLPSGTSCGCVKRRYREYDKYLKNDPHKLFYSSGEWKAKRADAIAFCDGMDLYSYYVLNKVEYGQTVHHIIPLEEDWGLRLADDNLIYLTESNHRAIHNEMKAGGARRAAIQGLLRATLDKHRAGLE